MNIQAPADYYDRTDPVKNYEQHLFLAGNVVQSAELNEIQTAARTRLAAVANALFKDGDVIRDAQVFVDQNTGAASCAPGAIYIAGSVRGVPPATLQVPATGTYSIGIRLTETLVDSDLADGATAVDTGLVDPAVGERAYGEKGAMRLQITPVWSLSTGSGGQFYPVYTVIDLVLQSKETPPNFDAMTQSLARYDRDSTGGGYVVTGMQVRQLADSGGLQNYSVGEGRARVYGYAVEFSTARRLVLNAQPDLKAVATEPHTSTGPVAQRVNTNRAPISAVQSVTITAERTVTMTRGLAANGQDAIPDASVLQVLSVVQGVTTYVAGTSWQLTNGNIDWSPAGAEPASGSTYTVTYRYLTNVTPTGVDDTGMTVTGAVSGTSILISYTWKLPRVDRICLDADGNLIWVKGVSVEANPQPPVIAADLLPLSKINQVWTASRTTTDDGVRTVTMPQISSVFGRIDWLAQLIAQNRLESNIHTREGGTKKGLFTDPFLGEDQRDLGSTNTAAVVSGELQLAIVPSVFQMQSDVATPATLAYSHGTVLEQTLRTGSMLINAYDAFAPVPPRLTIMPSVDRWVDVQGTSIAPTTTRFVVGQGDQSSSTSVTRRALISQNYTLAETLRQINVAFRVSGFGPGEVLSGLTFDGKTVSVGGLVADLSGVITGTFAIPAGIPTGAKLVQATGASGAVASASFSGQGTIEHQVWQQQTTVTERRWQSPPPPPPPNVTMQSEDPLAQTFTLPQNQQISGIEVWVVVKPTTRTRVQIRGTAVGLPTSTILAEKYLEPVDIALGLQRFAFDYPVQLFGGIEYALVILCDDAIGKLAVAELGKFDSNVQRWVTSQPYQIGVLLSSSNTSTWTPHQDRDLTFRLLKPGYTQTQRVIALGSVAVVAATDFLLMSYAETPSSATNVVYTLGLPDGTSLQVSDGQPVALAAPVTGNVSVTATLNGTADESPVLHPGTQLVAGSLTGTGVYTGRFVTCGTNSTVKVIVQALALSGATLGVQYKGAGSTWIDIAQSSSATAEDGFTEVTYAVTGVNEPNGIQVRLNLAGNAGARIRVRDLRVIVL